MDCCAWKTPVVPSLRRATGGSPWAQTKSAAPPCERQPADLTPRVIVGGNRGEGALPRGVDGGCETGERLPLVSEL